MTEFVMLPAIAPVIVPPFWANGSSCWVMRFVWGLVMVGGGRRRRRRSRSSATGCSVDGERCQT